MNPRPSGNEPDELPTALSRFVRIPFDDFLNLRKHLCTISTDYQVFFSWALLISLRRCAYLSSSRRYPACIGMEGFEPPSTRDLSRILAPTSSIPIMSRTNRGIVCKKRSLKHVHLHFGGMGRDGLEPTESEDTRFTVWPATNYGIPSLNRHRPVSNSFVRAMPCTMRFLRIISFYRQSTRRSFALKQ